ncbi:hypothetical protein PYW07_011548 [Mythimna separata]|uniref:Partial AB-hydrolase lipase domain-containing protein n=1 Tax=Mythimna separata TaxID=271217 RepID=A0AAD7Y9M7_MYTSE|nr:hypothetical protein PYW07_011548 [Mythimna separata]
MVQKHLLIIALLLHICHGARRENLLKETVTNIAEGITNNPVVSLTTHAYSNAFAAAVNAVTWMPNVIANALGPMTLPQYISDTNHGEKADKFVVDFSAARANEDAKLGIVELIFKYGFPVQEHEVETEDGYQLTMFRIPGTGPVVFLMHGLLGSADDFVVAGRESGLAYMLADAGYDVWMGNARGNKHSRKHFILQPSEAAFWDFSWHEIGVYDLPAMIDYILNKTDETSLKYIGHSQGTTSFFVMASERPEYNEKIALMVALSPVAYMSNVQSPIVRLMSPGTFILHRLSKSLGLYEFLPDNNLIRTLKLLICGTGPVSEILCSNTLFLMSGYDFPQLNVTNLPVVLGHLPSGASMKQFAHYGQGILSNDFRKFDYGVRENLARYGIEIPPRYDLKKIVAPVSMFCSDSDWLAHPIDVVRLVNRLPNVVGFYKVPLKQFNHVDFILAKDVKELLYNKVLSELELF